MSIIAKSTTRASAAPARERLNIRFPQRGTKDVPQDDEWGELAQGEHVTRIRFHDYAQAFSIPGLYNQLFGGLDSETKCISLQVVAGLLRDQLSLVLPGNNSRDRGQHEGKPKLRVRDLASKKNCHHDFLPLFELTGISAATCNCFYEKKYSCGYVNPHDDMHLF
ncbi:hypothetical protein INS49_007615 [Diaporthe citri]|uniref:uncharacterized protein n=1 Tax=Diaporthe citri TaxID=83186 RepID=UPI001C8105BA|nr:uncharacterized protein INS49_007615 [Diaporthe citri]KAG6362523.1 hypothetical protein INS49_007615 [Diaporthe citri]